jgi:aspartyl-tRNA(Asn)/glutamyl-tRNA(Gln) amidotransferase subunit A
MTTSTMSALQTALSLGRTSAEALAQHYLDAIATRNDDVNCYITVTPEHAIEQARAADTRGLQGQETAHGASFTHTLEGIPVAVKDLFCTAGIRTTCASKMLENFTSPYDATLVSRLREAGMVLLGKTNMDEFAMGSSSENSHFGAVTNPWDRTKVAGGSSGGSAAAVASGLAPIAIGTDTGGSIRQPASLCGITGLKPTYGRVSRYGMIAYASSLDQAGIFGHSAADIAPVLNAIAGFDPRDSTSAQQSVPDYTEALASPPSERPLDGLRVGVPREHFGEGLDEDVSVVVREAIAALEHLGATVVDINLPNSERAIPAYYIIAPAECSSNLSRFDGVRFGYRSPNADSLEELYERSRGEAFGEEVIRRILVGTYALSAGYYDAYYCKAQQLRRMVSDDFQQAFKHVDVIAGPTSPSVAFGLGERTDDPVSMYLSDIYTISVNLAGLCAMSVPAGFAHGLPVGLQLIGNHFEESALLRTAHQFQQHTSWHEARPPGYIALPTTSADAGTAISDAMKGEN